MSIDKTRAVMETYWGGHGLDSVAEDAIFTMMGTGVESKGREAIAQTMNYFYAVAFEGTFETRNKIIGEGQAVVEGYLVGKHIGEFAGIPATGKDVRVPMCVIYDVADDHIKRARIYFEMPSLLAQLGKV